MRRTERIVSGNNTVVCRQGRDKTAEKKKVPLQSECTQVLKTAVTLPCLLITAIIAKSLCRTATLDFFIF